MEFGDDEMLLSQSAKGAKTVGECFASEATRRGLGVQGKKTAARKWGSEETLPLIIGGAIVKYVEETVLYLGCLFAPSLRLDKH